MCGDRIGCKPQQVCYWLASFFYFFLFRSFLFNSRIYQVRTERRLEVYSFLSLLFVSSFLFFFFFLISNKRIL